MSETIDLAPSLPRFDADATDALLARRQPALGEYLGGTVGEGWWNSLPGVVGAAGRAAAEGEGTAPIDRDAWRYHPLWREGIAWDERMTEGRAAAMARTHDENRYRRALMAAREPGAFESVLGFGGMLVGSIPDPVNFIPLAGPLGRLLRGAEAAAEVGLAARLAGGAARALEAPGVGAAALRGGVEGLAGNALAAPVVYGVQAQFGDEITFDGVVLDLALGALVGAGFGAAGGLASGALDGRAAVRLLDAAARDVAAGRAPDVPGALARRVAEDAVVRTAPDGVRWMLAPDDAPLAGLPTRPDGAALTREEFGSVLAQRDRVEEAAAAADAAVAEAGKARTLLREVMANGGLRDEGGELMQMLGGTTRTRPGLINNQPRARTPDGTAWMGGRSLDEAAQSAREAGFFPERDVGEITPRDMLDALDAELRGREYRTADGAGARPFPESGERIRGEHAQRVDEAFAWYREAAEVQRRLAAMPASVREAVSERAAIMEFEGGMSREEATARAGRDLEGSADPELAAALRDIEALRAEGRFGPGDEAIIRAGDEAAAELASVAKGLEGAAACILRGAA